MKFDKSKIYLLSLPFLFSVFSCDQEATFSGGHKLKNQADAIPLQEKTFEQTFTSAKLEEASLTVSGPLDQAELSIPLTFNSETIQKEFHQETRPTLMKSFRQGSLGEEIREEVNQGNLGILDILLVVDNSGSMAEEQRELAKRLDPLISQVQGSDWKIFLTTTDAGRGCSERVFSHNMPKVNNEFKKAIKGIGIQGSSNEQGIKKAVDLLNCKDSEMVRANSNIAVIIVSDEDNCSNGTECSDPSELNLLNALVSPPHQRKLGDSAKVYGIFDVPGKECRTAFNVGNIYQKAVDATDGVSGSICASNYKDILEAISSDMLGALILQFPLSATPRMDSMEVTINGMKLDSGFQIENNSIIFDEAPPENAKIVLNYLTGDNTIESRFQLEESIDSSTLQVVVNGKNADPSEYEIQKDSIVFNSPPDGLAEIIVTYKKMLEKKAILDLEDELDDIVIYLNGEILPQDHYEYDKSSGKLHLTKELEEGSTIIADYKKRTTQKLEYDISLQADDLYSYEAYFKDEPDSLIEVEIVENKLRIDSGNFSPDKTLVLNYLLADSDGISMELPHSPIPESITFTGIPDGCNEEDLVVDNQVLMTNCIFGPKESFQISYQFLSETLTDFVLEDIENPDMAEWEVRVNGQLLEEGLIERFGNRIKVLKDLGPSDVVWVKATVRDHK